jgi:membrane associated rhomboid family serine protease
MVFTPLHDQNPLKIIPFQRVTLSIIALCCTAFLAQRLLPIAEAGSLFHGLGLVPAVLLDGTQVPLGSPLVPAELTILTAAFVHGGWLHLIGNMLFLWVFGDNVEDSMGHLQFAAFYLLCAAAAGVAHVLSAPDSTDTLVGASGAIAGVLGAYLVLHPRVKVLVLLFRRVPVLLPAYLLIGGWLLIQLFSVWSGNNQSVAWWAHIGGFVAGAVLIVPFRYKQVPLFDGGLRR